MTRNTYAGIPQELSVLGNSKIVLIPVPYDGTSTWQKGADKGPQAFLSASQNMELFDIETQTQVYKQGVYLADAVTQNGSPQAMVDAVHAVTKSYILKNKFVTIFGGEHSISIGTIRAFNECFDNLTVLQLDAHADLRKHYQGSSFNHACALYEASQTTNLLQVGIRSMDISEVTVMDKENIFFAHQLTEDDSWMDASIDKMTENVFITIDLDVFDPSIMPSTGTPEPGGLLWYETLDYLKKIFKDNNCTWFLPKISKLDARKKWIISSISPKGEVVIDDGAKQALSNGKSLLAAGITKVSGKFKKGDHIKVLDKNNNECARGLSSFSSDEIERIKGYHSREIEKILGYVAKSYLQESNQLFVTRVLGLTGYKPGKTYGIKTLGGVNIDLTSTPTTSGSTLNPTSLSTITGSTFYAELSGKTSTEGTSITDYLIAGSN